MLEVRRGRVLWVFTIVILAPRLEDFIEKKQERKQERKKDRRVAQGLIALTGRSLGAALEVSFALGLPPNCGQLCGLVGKLVGLNGFCSNKARLIGLLSGWAVPSFR
jgi:hypothetical protein